jgi:hypothetical protein
MGTTGEAMLALPTTEVGITEAGSEVSTDEDCNMYLRRLSEGISEGTVFAVGHGRPSREQWEACRPFFTLYYKTKGQPLRLVRSILANEYGFHAR